MCSVIRREYIPDNSTISDDFGEFDYCDSYETKISVRNEGIDQILTNLFDLSSLSWIIVLKHIRDILVKRFGLQIDESIPTNKVNNYEPGSKVLLFAFTVLQRNENEIVMGKNDKHLKYRLSILFDQNDSRVYVTTIVKYHNLGGKTYFRLVMPFHQLIVYSLVKRNLS